jgi:predicted permease
MNREFWHDALSAWRGLLRKPFYPAATILMLALAIGANMAAFGIYYGYDWRPLPYADPGRLVLVGSPDRRLGLFDPMTTPEVYKLITTELSAAQSAGLWTFGGDVVANIQNTPREVFAAQITPSFLTTLGARTMLGRLPDAAAGLPGGPAEGAISYAFWKSAFAGRADAIGQHILINKISYQVVGVLAPNFGFNNPTNIWTAAAPPEQPDQINNANYFLAVRLAPGVSKAAFMQQLQTLLPEIKREIRAVDGNPAEAADMEIDAEPLRPAMLGQAQIGSLPKLLQGMAAFLLLLAIANAGNLALVRTQSRLPGFALSRMLGASRLGLLRLFLAEHLPLWVLSGLAGSAIGAVALHSLASFQNIFDNPPFDIATGWPVYVFGWVLTTLSILLVTLIPALQILRQRLAGAMGPSNKSTLSAAARWAQTGFGALQIALATALLIGSATLSLSLYNILTQPRGFNADGRIVASILLPPSTLNVTGLQHAIDAVRALPISLAASGGVYWAYPFGDAVTEFGISPTSDKTNSQQAHVVALIGDYFKTLGIQVESGQSFDQAALTGTGGNVAVLSPDLARALFGDKAAIGAMVDIGFTDVRVIGVTTPLLWRPTQDDLAARNVIFLPTASLNKMFQEFPITGATLVVHVRGGEGSDMALIKRTIEAAVPGALVTAIEPLSQIVFNVTAFQAVIAGLVAGCALLALILAALGVYAVNAFIARARQPEFGMRAMLGASPAALLRTAFADAARLLALGLVGGALGGYLLVRAMSPLLFHADAAAPFVFIAALVVIALVVLIAAWRPAARAAATPVKQLLEAA